MSHASLVYANNAGNGGLKTEKSTDASGICAIHGMQSPWWTWNN
jgi:hypothetical protein